jgi:hypothetical protein
MAGKNEHQGFNAPTNSDREFGDFPADIMNLFAAFGIGDKVPIPSHTVKGDGTRAVNPGIQLGEGNYKGQLPSTASYARPAIDVLPQAATGGTGTHPTPIDQQFGSVPSRKPEVPSNGASFPNTPPPGTVDPSNGASFPNTPPPGTVDPSSGGPNTGVPGSNAPFPNTPPPGTVDPRFGGEPSTLESIKDFYTQPGTAPFEGAANIVGGVADKAVDVGTMGSGELLKFLISLVTRPNSDIRPQSSAAIDNTVQGITNATTGDIGTQIYNSNPAQQFEAGQSGISALGDDISEFINPADQQQGLEQLGPLLMDLLGQLPTQPLRSKEQQKLARRQQLLNSFDVSQYRRDKNKRDKERRQDTLDDSGSF